MLAPLLNRINPTAPSSTSNPPSICWPGVRPHVLRPFGPNKLPARTFVVEKVKDQIWGRNLLVMKGTRLYHVIVMGDKKYIHSKDADAIMASFEITK